jgi:hypothetical protein
MYEKFGKYSKENLFFSHRERGKIKRLINVRLSISRGKIINLAFCSLP